MSAHDREVAGIRCTDVLGLLSDYLDGELAPAQAQRIEAHLEGCDWCERFGGDYMAVVTTLRSTLAAPGDLEPDVHDRLLSRLRGDR